MQREMSSPPGSPEVYNDLFGFCGVQDQVVVCAPLNQMLNLLPVSLFLIIRDESNKSGVISKLYYTV